ncbi:hypothetical protein C8R46DRAFT_1229775 [Mycena filopes]|nr:hypothetical protein C8R46DRAFT_1229775 [Mycena filopes]
MNRDFKNLCNELPLQGKVSFGLVFLDTDPLFASGLTEVGRYVEVKLSPRLFNLTLLVIKTLLELFKVGSAGAQIDRFKISRVILALVDANYTNLSANSCETMLETYRTIRVEFHPQPSTTMYSTRCRARQPTPQLTQILTGPWLDYDEIEPASTRALTFNFDFDLGAAHTHRDYPRLRRGNMVVTLAAWAWVCFEVLLASIAYFVYTWSDDLE